MLGPKSIGRNLCRSKIRPVYQLKPQLNSELRPDYEYELKSELKFLGN